MTWKRTWWMAIAGLAVIATAGCGHLPPTGGTAGPPTPSNVPTPNNVWKEPASYTYTVDSRCGERLLIGRIRLWVDQSAVVRAEGVDDPGRHLASQTKLANLPTLGQLLDEYTVARRDGADIATAVFDPADGHPTKIDLDPMKNAIDDEACYVISDYAVLPGPHSPS